MEVRVVSIGETGEPRMNAIHYSSSELAEMLARAAFGSRLGDHLNVCEQCHFLLALVRRARGDPSDEQREVTTDALRNWVES